MNTTNEEVNFDELSHQYHDQMYQLHQRHYEQSLSPQQT